MLSIGDIFLPRDGKSYLSLPFCVGILSSLDICRPIAGCCSLCKFTHVYSWCSWKALCPWFLLSLLILIIFLPTLSWSSLIFEGRGLKGTFHLGLGVARFLTICNCPVVGFYNCFYSLLVETSLMLTEQDTNPWVEKIVDMRHSVATSHSVATFFYQSHRFCSSSSIVMIFLVLGS